MFAIRSLGKWLIGVLTLGVVAPLASAEDPPKSPTEELAWSKESNGLVGRLEIPLGVYYSMYCTETYLRLKNVGSSSLAVPQRIWLNARSPYGCEVEAAEQRTWRRVWWDYEQDEDRKREEEEVPIHEPPTLVTLRPGESTLCVLEGWFAASLRTKDQIRMVFRGKRAIREGAWTGRLDLPAVPLQLAEAQQKALYGSIPCPEHLPALSTVRGGFLNSDGEDSDYSCLHLTNNGLLWQLKLYPAGQVASQMERRLAAEADVHVQLHYAVEAALRGSEDGRRVIRERLRDQRSEVVSSAVDALGYASARVQVAGNDVPEWMIDAALDALTDKRVSSDSGGVLQSDFAGRLTQVLRGTNAKRAVPLLARLIESGDPPDAASASYVLSKIGDKSVVPILMKQAEENSSKVRLSDGLIEPAEFRAAAFALAGLKDKQVVPLLTKNVIDEDIVYLLEKLGDPRAISALRDVVRHGKPRNTAEHSPESMAHCVGAAKIALSTLEPGDPVPRYLKLLEDETLDTWCRRHVIWRLGRKPDPRAIPLLVELAMQDPDGAIQNDALVALGEFRYRAGVQGLIQCFDAAFPTIDARKITYTPEWFEDRIADSLRKITGQPLGASPQSWRDWWYEQGEHELNLP
jgi:HEAT repeat protein